MKTQQELMQAYWGLGGTVDRVRIYNEKHGCDVKPWECVETPCVMYENHPGFILKDDNEYTFALTILYDDLRKEHRPVFVGDKLYTNREGREIVVRDGFLSISDYSWNPPTPKRTFKIGDMELPCPVKVNIETHNHFFLQVGASLFMFDSLADRNDVAAALYDILTAARDKE